MKGLKIQEMANHLLMPQIYIYPFQNNTMVHIERVLIKAFYANN